MKNSINLRPIIRGLFTIHKKNIITGEEEVFKGKNVLTSSAYAYLTGWYDASNRVSGTSLITPPYLDVGDGSTEPSAGDSQLAHRLWQLTGGVLTKRFAANFQSAAFDTVWTIPASTSYVGTIREIGFRGNYDVYDRATGQYFTSRSLLSHALLKDAEGIPIEIPKTELDIITITYTLEISLSHGRLTGWHGQSRALASLILSDPWNCCFPGAIQLGTCLYRQDIHGGREYYPYHPLFPDNISLASRTVSLTDRNITLKLSRLAASHTLNGHYIFSMQLKRGRNYPGLDWINFPNQSVFPAATLRAQQVSVGDGTTQDFTPPIPMWVEDSEVVYLNGVAQVAGVDYTIDYWHNSQKLAELLPLWHALIDASCWDSSGIYVDLFPRDFVAYGVSTSQYNSGERTAYSARGYTPTEMQSDNTRYGMQGSQYGSVSRTRPLILEIPTDYTGFNWSVDTIYLYCTHNTGRFSVLVSDDKETWTTLLDNVQPWEGSSSRNQYAGWSYLSAWTEFSLQTPVLAKYWKLVWESGEASYSVGFMPCHKGHALHFNNAPASGQIITMDCQIEVPYKDDQHVIDFSTTIQC